MSEIYKAIVKFQGEMKPVAKEGYNPHYKSKFADLSGIIQAISPGLAKNGLGFLQTMRVDGERNILTTKIIHVSGQAETSEIVIPPNNDPQKLGILITYLKRYSLQAALGIPTEDDDAEAVSAPMRSDSSSASPPPSDKQIAMLKNLGQQKGVSGSVPRTSKEASDLIAKLMAMPDAR